MNDKRKKLVYHLIFVAICAGLFLFLWNAPPETTARLPHDKNHEQFMKMKKKQAEKLCDKCHGNDKIAPLSKNHPPKYRCLFCHKKD